MTLVTTQERNAVRCYFSNRYWKNKVNDNDLVLQEELQRESQLSCGYWWTGVAWGDRWKCFPQYRWPKFRASRQGMSLIGCSYWSSCSFICLFSSDHTFVVVWLHPWMLSQGQRWNNIHSLSLFLSVCAPFRTHLLAWPTWVQPVTSTHFCKCGSTTWSCVGASISATIPEHRSTILSLV